MPITYQADLTQARQLLTEWIARSTKPEAVQWLQQKVALLTGENAARPFYLAFGAAPRMVGKEKLPLTEPDFRRANELRNGLLPTDWTTDQAARMVLILALPHQDSGQFISILNQAFSTAEVNEQLALYRSLPLLPHPEAHRARASEGIRTNISDVFNAVALDNPYPAEYLEENAWNQLVLKAVFVGSPLHRIQGLDQRANPMLARMLSDFAHERWAAKRPVTPELWRPVGPFIDEQMLPDIEKLFATGTESEQQAAALACAASNFTGAKALLQKHPALAKGIETGELSW